MELKGLIFDVDGTLAETEEVHRAAFNKAFADAGFDWQWSVADYGQLLKVIGGRQRILSFWKRQGIVVPGNRERLAARLHAAKTTVYNAMVRIGGLELRPGVARLIGEARAAGMKLGIATTSSRPNIYSLLATQFEAGAADWFGAIVTGEEVRVKKPDPEAYTFVLARLGLAPGQCLAIEDSQIGVEAARGAGLSTIAVPSLYSAGEDFSGAVAVLSSLGEASRPAKWLGGTVAPAPIADLRALKAWHAALDPAPA